MVSKPAGCEVGPGFDPLAGGTMVELFTELKRSRVTPGHKMQKTHKNTTLLVSTYRQENVLVLRIGKPKLGALAQACVKAWHMSKSGGMIPHILFYHVLLHRMVCFIRNWPVTAMVSVNYNHGPDNYRDTKS